MVSWNEREENGKTIRTTTYQGYALEVAATAVGSEGHFAASIYRITPSGSSERDNTPHWGSSAHETLEKACRAAVRQVDADR